MLGTICTVVDACMFLNYIDQGLRMKQLNSLNLPHMPINRIFCCICLLVWLYGCNFLQVLTENLAVWLRNPSHLNWKMEILGLNVNLACTIRENFVAAKRADA